MDANWADQIVLPAVRLQRNGNDDGGESKSQPRSGPSPLFSRLATMLSSS